MLTRLLFKASPTPPPRGGPEPGPGQLFGKPPLATDPRGGVSPARPPLRHPVQVLAGTRHVFHFICTQGGPFDLSPFHGLPPHLSLHTMKVLCECGLHIASNPGAMREHRGGKEHKRRLALQQSRGSLDRLLWRTPPAASTSSSSSCSTSTAGDALVQPPVAAAEPSPAPAPPAAAAPRREPPSHAQRVEAIMKVAHFDCAKTEVYEQGAVGGGHSILDKTRPRRKHASSRSTTWTFNGPSSSTPTASHHPL